MSSEFSEASLKLILDTAKDSISAAKSIAVLSLPGTRRHLIVNAIAQTVEEYDSEPSARNHKLLSVNDVVAWAQSNLQQNPIVWIADERIIVTLDEDNARVLGDKATYEWAVTDEFQTLAAYSEAGGENLDQKTLIFLLRTKFWNCFANPGNRDSLIAQLRKIVAQQTSGLNQGKGTYEAGLETADGSATKWPDRLAMRARVFDDASLVTLQDLDVVFEVDPQSRTFSLVPTSSSITAAKRNVIEQASELIRESLKDTPDIKVYAGHP